MFDCRKSRITAFLRLHQIIMTEKILEKVLQMNYNISFCYHISKNKQHRLKISLEGFGGNRSFRSVPVRRGGGGLKERTVHKKKLTNGKLSKICKLCLDLNKHTLYYRDVSEPSPSKHQTTGHIYICYYFLEELLSSLKVLKTRRKKTNKRKRTIT